MKYLKQKQKKRCCYFYTLGTRSFQFLAATLDNVTHNKTHQMHFSNLLLFLVIIIIIIIIIVIVIIIIIIIIIISYNFMPIYNTIAEPIPWA